MRVGLCGSCRHRREIRNRRGSFFLLCTLAAKDPRFRRYPPLPVFQCPGYDPGDPVVDGDDLEAPPPPS